MNLWTSYEPLLCIFTLAIYSCCNCMANYCLEHLQPYIFHFCPSAMQSNLYNLDVLTCVTKVNFFTPTACLWISGVWRGCGDHPASQKSPGAPKYRPLRLHCWRIHSDKTRRDYDRPLGNRGLRLFLGSVLFPSQNASSHAVNLPPRWVARGKEANTARRRRKKR